MTRNNRAQKRKQAFTLVELLVVMAITAILFGLVFGPVVQGFNLTNRARVQVLAQDTARRVMEEVMRDTSNGVFIFDNSNQLINFWLPDSNGNPLLQQVPFAVVDLVPPVRYIDQQQYSFVELHPELLDPTTGSPLASPQLEQALQLIGAAEVPSNPAKYLPLAETAIPVAPARVIHRYWLGLRNNASTTDGALGMDRPLKLYGNFYDSKGRTPIADHNPFILYRAIVSPYLPNRDTGTGQVQVDTRLFRTTLVGGRPVPILNDPNFFYDNAPAQPVQLPDGTTTNRMPGWKDLNKDGIVNISENWAAIANPLTPKDRADEVIVERDRTGTPIYFNDPGNGQLKMQLTPQMRFQPTFIGNDSGTPTRTTDPSNEAASVSPSAHVETYGHWTLPYNHYVIRGSMNANPLPYFYFNGAETDSGGTTTFNITQQQLDQTTGTSTNMGSANFRVLTTPYRNRGQLHLPPNTRPELMMTVDPKRGLTNFAFPDSLVLHVNGVPAPSTFDAAAVNAAYSVMAAGGGDAYRYISLASLDPSLNPPLSNGQRPPLERQADGRSYIPNCRIVPGSEVVRGPDMRLGPNRGRLITYTRVPRTTDPQRLGPNEYMINYDNVRNMSNPNDPLQTAGTILFNSLPDSPGNFNSLPETYLDAANVQQPARIYVTYQIQNNLTSDVVKADYLTRQLMTFALGVRLFDLNSGQPQLTTLTQKIKVRNLQR
jgi:prepilin-type N-terminal cleavage/methylation domain-containing protein